MIFRKKQITSSDLVDSFAAVLERGPRGSGTLHELGDLPAEKPLMKAALIARAYELGPSSIDAIKAAFVLIANFQANTSEPSSRHFEVAAEMALLSIEFDERTHSLREQLHA